MMATVFRIGWLSLRRDRLALVLTFVVPIAFFSLFSVVFGSMDEGGFNPVRTALVAAPGSPIAESLRPLLETDPALEMVAPVDRRERAVDAVRRGHVTVAVVLPADRPAVELLADTSNPLAVQVAQAALQRASARLAGLEAPPYRVEVHSVLGGDDKRPSVSFFAAGIGVMFLLFAVSGRSAILIEERESGVLGRMLASSLGLGRFLLGRWLFLSLLGVVQVTLMFVWGSLVFGLDLWAPKTLAGFAVITLATAAAAAGFGILLSCCCRTRAQLNGLSVMIVLLMSAVGGSMFPRFLMPETLQQIGLLTFNAWALDGYHQVFWYELSPLALWPQLAVLVLLTLLFLSLSRLMVARQITS